jgi:hypothetical protein
MKALDCRVDGSPVGGTVQHSGVTKALIVAVVLIVAAALAAHFLAHLY